MLTLNSSRTVSALVLLAATGSPAPGAIIYQARAASPSGILLMTELDEPSSFAELPGSATEREFDARVGDAITFAGTDRLVTGFTTRLAAFGGAARGISVDVELSIYENNGGLPGALLWSGVTPSVSLPTISGIASVEVNFAPNITVPDSVCFALAFTNQSVTSGETRTMGVVTTANATVGSSPVTTIHQLSADNTWAFEDNSTFAGGLFRHIDARVEAIPSPPAATLGMLALLLRRRPRR